MITATLEIHKPYSPHLMQALLDCRFTLLDVEPIDNGIRLRGMSPYFFRDGVHTLFISEFNGDYNDSWMTRNEIT